MTTFYYISRGIVSQIHNFGFFFLVEQVLFNLVLHDLIQIFQANSVNFLSSRFLLVGWGDFGLFRYEFVLDRFSLPRIRMTENFWLRFLETYFWSLGFFCPFRLHQRSGQFYPPHLAIFSSLAFFR